MNEKIDSWVGNEKIYTLEEYSKHFSKDVAEFIANFSDKDKFFIEEELYTNNWYVPTKWEKFKYRIADYKQRCKDIWTILRGRDIHEDCGP